MAVVGTEVRPPYVKFERRSIEDRTNELSKGKYGFKDVDIAKITVAGQKDIVDRVATDWLEDLEKRAQDGLVPFEWPTHFRAMYQKWKEGQELPVNGTPIRGWMVVSPAVQETLVSVGVLTVEDLAALSDEAIRNVGTGAMTFKQKAQAWLQEATDKGSVAIENANLRRDLEAQASTIAAQAEQLNELKALVKQYLPKDKPSF